MHGSNDRVLLHEAESPEETAAEPLEKVFAGLGKLL